MRVFAHIATIIILMGVLLGIPLGLCGNMAKITAYAQGQVDAVSGATYSSTAVIKTVQATVKKLKN